MPGSALVRSCQCRARERGADDAQRSWDAWTRNDARAFAALFAEHVDYVAFDGSHTLGRAAVEQAHA